MGDICRLIESARSHLDDDLYLANYMLRDTEEVEAAGLKDLSWAMHQGSPHRNDVIYLIEMLEAYLEGKEDK